MIYTIGHRESYERALSDSPVVRKLGRRADYPGGSVWQSPEEASGYLADEGLTDYAVYGVEAEWGVDTVPSEDGPWHDLLRDARLIRLPLRRTA